MPPEFLALQVILSVRTGLICQAMWLPLSQLHRGSRWQWVDDGYAVKGFSRKTPLDTMRDTTNLALVVFERFCIFHSWLAEWPKCKILHTPLEVQTARRPPSEPRERGKKHFWCFGTLWYDCVRLSIYEITSLWALEVGICLVFHINTVSTYVLPNVLWREQAAILSGAVGVVLAVVLAS